MSTRRRPASSTRQKPSSRRRRKQRRAPPARPCQKMLGKVRTRSYNCNATCPECLPLQPATQRLECLLGYRHDSHVRGGGAASFNQNLGSWHIALIDLSVSNDERMVGSIVAQDPVLTSHRPAYSVTGAHADLFEVVDGSSLRLKPDQNVVLGTAYQASVTAAGPLQIRIFWGDQVLFWSGTVLAGCPAICSGGRAACRAK